MKKYLTFKTLHKVHPKFRKMCREALKNGEQVPYGVTLLSISPPTKEDIEWGLKLIKKYKLKK
jgi:hypothetical protein